MAGGGGGQGHWSAGGVAGWGPAPLVMFTQHSDTTLKVEFTIIVVGWQRRGGATAQPHNRSWLLIPFNESCGQ